jgi:hypothetical protein
VPVAPSRRSLDDPARTVENVIDKHLPEVGNESSLVGKRELGFFRMAEEAVSHLLPIAV